jgi:hypothetical protein
MSAPGKKESGKLSSKAWLQHGPKGMFGPSEAGILLAMGDWVSFITPDGPVFEADRVEIRVNWPWWEGGGGVHLTVGSKIYRLALARPRNAPPDPDESWSKLLFSPSHGEIGEAIGGIGEVFKARATGKAWKAYFSSETAEATAHDQADTHVGRQAAEKATHQREPGRTPAT